MTFKPNEEILEAIYDEYKEYVNYLIDVYNKYYLDFFTKVSKEIYKKLKGELSLYQKKTAYFKLNYLLIQIYKCEKCKEAIFIEKSIQKAHNNCNLSKKSLEMFFKNYPDKLIYESNIEVDNNYLPIPKIYRNFIIQFNTLNSPQYVSDLYDSIKDNLLDLNTFEKILPDINNTKNNITNKMFKNNKSRISNSLYPINLLLKPTDTFIDAILYKKLWDKGNKNKLKIYKTIKIFKKAILNNDETKLEELFDNFGNKDNIEIIKNDKKSFLSKIEKIIELL